MNKGRGVSFRREKIRAKLRTTEDKVRLSLNFNGRTYQEEEGQVLRFQIVVVACLWGYTERDKERREVKI